MNCHYIRYPLTYFFDKMKEYGLQHIELFGGMPHFYLQDVDEYLVNKIKKECIERELAIVSFTPAQGVYPMSVSIEDEKPRRRTIELLKKGINISREIGAEKMLVSPGFGYESQNADYVWGICRDSLIELSEYASEKKIILMIEPLTPMSSNVINTSAQSARMIREVNSPWLKSMMDIGVMNYMQESIEQYFDTLGENLVHIPFTDGPGAHVALGDGLFPMIEYAKQIEQKNYRHYCSFEINDKRYLRVPDIATERNIAWLRENNFWNN
jgi:protein FrlC